LKVFSNEGSGMSIRGLCKSVLIFSFCHGMVGHFLIAEPEQVPSVVQSLPDQAVSPQAPQISHQPQDIDPQAQAPQASQVEEPPAGAETTTLSEDKIGSQGNWRKKRRWLEEALPINNEVQAALGLLEQASKALNEKYASIQQDLGLFYRSFGFEQGKIALILQDIEKFLEKKKKKEVEELAQAAEEEREVQASLYDDKAEEVEQKSHEQKREFEQLQLDIKSIEDLDASLTERLKKADEQVAVVLNDSAQTRTLIDEMWYIIDDLKARDNFYQIKNIGEKVKNIVNYIQVDLSKDFDEVITRIRTQMDKTKTGITGLEAKGIIIENRTQRVEQLRLEKLKKQQEEEAARMAGKVAHAKKVKEAQVAWYLWPFVSIKNVAVDSVGYCVELVQSFFSSPVSAKPRKNRKSQEGNTVNE